MHVGAVSLAATPLTAGAAADRLAGTASLILLALEATLSVPGNYVTWYASESIGVKVLDEGIAIDVTPNVGVVTE
jgi:hypothetical protein